MKVKSLTVIEEIKTKSMEELNDIPKSAFPKSFEDWNKRWHKCIISKEDYFQENEIKFDK